MRLVIVRHAEALRTCEVRQRPLSPNGIRQARQVGARLRQLGMEVDELWHSAKQRAKETAEIMASKLGQAPEVKQRDDLGPNDPVEPITREILDRDESLMIVSHLPFVRYLTAVLVSLHKQQLPDFSPCCAVVLEREDTIGSWSISEVITPDD